MRSLVVAGFVFAIIAGSGIGSLILGGRLPQELQDEASRDAVRHIASFVATLSALVLGLFIASAKTNFDERSNQGGLSVRSLLGIRLGAEGFYTGSNRLNGYGGKFYIRLPIVGWLSGLSGPVVARYWPDPEYGSALR